MPAETIIALIAGMLIPCVMYETRRWAYLTRQELHMRAAYAALDDILAQGNPLEDIGRRAGVVQMRSETDPLFKKRVVTRLIKIQHTSIIKE
jgi:hypothetical protein